MANAHETDVISHAENEAHNTVGVSRAGPKADVRLNQEGTTMRSPRPLMTFVLTAALLILDSFGPCEAQTELVTRQRVQLNLSGAEVILKAAKAKAEELKVKVNVAIVDDGGHLIAFQRRDGARPASVATAMTKAVAAATTRQPTGPIRRGDAEHDVLLNLSLQNAAHAGGGKMTSLLGGVPIVFDGQVVGAVGVGGGTGEQDAEVAKAGIEALLNELK